ncbi:Glycosyl transferase family 2 [Pseudomonas sp. NFACC02]|uniref:glycosyltransferase family 2 protein n=1 Tax=Pseudomonas sp. NFACC02 TaxID=1566250 RepID=UPI0008B77DBA|nr:glycosyltransferase family 2 protein [Pseudomonas sp. NFACC02]SER59970.1 Glycosyl transferase family 2 [Pseudomonas sp. NFACC02]
MKRPSNLAIIAIFKNEAPYILEWLSHHINIGVDFFYIADNESNDGTSELLAALDSMNLIRHIKFPTPKDSPPQLPAYEKLMREYGNMHEWCAFIDADEFIVPQGSDTLDSMLSRHSEDPAIGGIALNWAVYGSSNLQTYSGELVMERFTQRGDKTITLNKHFKSIVRSNAFKATAGNPHSFKLNDGFYYVHTDGKPVSNLVDAVDGLSKGVCWDYFRLNHYVVKSYEEFINKKNRGRATKPAVSVENRNQSFFLEHDVNDVTELPNREILEATLVKMHEIKERLTEAFGPTILEHGKFVLNNLIHGHHDISEVVGDVIQIRGWAFSTDYKKTSYSLTYKQTMLIIEEVREVDRPDVKHAYPDAPINSGFVITARKPPALQDIDPSILEVTVSVGAKSVQLRKD